MLRPTFAVAASFVTQIVWTTTTFAQPAPAELGRYGEVSVVGPVAELGVYRAHVGEVLAAILDQHTLADMSVHDSPLDQVIAMVFEEANRGMRKKSRRRNEWEASDAG